MWYFAALAVIATLAVGISWVWYHSEPFTPLTPERLSAARELWRKNRPADYDLKIVVTKQYRSVDGVRGTQVDKYDVQVRGGIVAEFLINGKEPEPLLDRADNRNLAEERRQREHYDVDGLFDSIEELMEKDRRDGRSSFIRARFDKSDGHVMLFARQFQGLREQHIKVEMQRVAAAE